MSTVMSGAVGRVMRGGMSSVTRSGVHRGGLDRLPPLAQRLAEGRPVMTREQLANVGQFLVRHSTTQIFDFRVSHTVRVVTRLANGRVLNSDDGETLFVSLGVMGNEPPGCAFTTNQFDEAVLLAGLRQIEAALRALPSYQDDNGLEHATKVQDTTVPVQLWHDNTVRAMVSSRGTVIPEILHAVRDRGLQASGFIGLMARAEAVIAKDGNITFFYDETDGEIDVTASDAPARSFGWGGCSARDWAKLDYRGATQHAIEMGMLGRNPVAVEPGRRTAILTPQALAPMLRYFGWQFDAGATNLGHTALSKSRQGGNKLKQRIMDPRLRMSSDPNDPEGGYRPYLQYELGATPPMTWVENGVLKNLAYSIQNAMGAGKPYAEYPHSFRLSGGPTSVAEMIAQCKEGILVNRTCDVDLVDEYSCQLTGATQGGCFLIKDGKISKPVKNFRFLESPFFFLNRIDALGAPVRAAFGYTPQSKRGDGDGTWPRPPIIVPPMMVHDFNFSSLADAV